MRGVDLARRRSSSTNEVTSFPDRLLNVEEAADLLKLKPATLYQWAYERRIPIVKPSGPRGPLRFRLSTLMKLIDTWEQPASRPLPERD
jgi:excisionase family DNA binding protein